MNFHRDNGRLRASTSDRTIRANDSSLKAAERIASVDLRGEGT